MFKVGSTLMAMFTAVAITSSAAAQEYPIRPLTWVVAFPPGGTADTTSRLIAKALGERLGQPVIVENKPGAGGIVAAEYVANAKPDGYTLLYSASGPMTIYQFLYKKLSYDPQKSFVPVLGVSESPMLLMVRADSRYKTLSDFVDDAKKSPNKMNYATFGRGSTNHLIGELLQSEANIAMADIAYKGGLPAQTDLMAGTIDMAFDMSAAMKPQIEAGKLRALAVSGTKRLASLPDVPTFAELGYPGVVLTIGSTVHLPAGTPQPIVDKLTAELGRILEDSNMVKYFDDQGATSTRQFTKESLAEELARRRVKIKAVIEKAGIEPQ